MIEVEFSISRHLDVNVVKLTSMDSHTTRTIKANARGAIKLVKLVSEANRTNAYRVKMIEFSPNKDTVAVNKTSRKIPIKFVNVCHPIYTMETSAQ